MATFKLIHASDLHFAVEANYGNVLDTYFKWQLKWSNPFRPSTYIYEKALLLPKILIENANGIDALLITGDIATTGSENDLVSAKEWITGNAAAKLIPKFPGFQSNASSKLSEVADTTILMPGNHDRYQGRAYTPRSILFESVFGDNWDNGSGNTVAANNSPEIRKTVIQNASGQLVVICADFSLRQKTDQKFGIGYLGQGRAYQDICDELVQETHKSREEYPQALIVWVSHFPPKFKDNHPLLLLLEEERLLSAAGAAGVRAIFSGHTHIPKTYQADGSKVVVVCAGTPIAFSEKIKHSFNTVMLNANQDKLLDLAVVRCDWDDKEATYKPSDPTVRFNF